MPALRFSLLCCCFCACYSSDKAPAARFVARSSQTGLRASPLASSLLQLFLRGERKESIAQVCVKNERSAQAEGVQKQWRACAREWATMREGSEVGRTAGEGWKCSEDARNEFLKSIVLPRSPIVDARFDELIDKCFHFALALQMHRKASPHRIDGCPCSDSSRPTEARHATRLGMHSAQHAKFIHVRPSLQETTSHQQAEITKQVGMDTAHLKQERERERREWKERGREERERERERERETQKKRQTDRKREREEKACEHAPSHSHDSCNAHMHVAHCEPQHALLAPRSARSARSLLHVPSSALSALSALCSADHSYIFRREFEWSLFPVPIPPRTV